MVQWGTAKQPPGVLAIPRGLGQGMPILSTDTDSFSCVDCPGWAWRALFGRDAGLERRRR